MKAVKTMKNVKTIKETEKKLYRLLRDKKYSEAKELLCRYEASDIAELLAELDREQLILTFRLLPKEFAAKTFVEMDTDEKKYLIDSFTDKELTDILEELFYDDTADLVEEMPANVVRRILAAASSEARNTVNELLRYPPDSAGTIMTTEYVLLSADMTVDAAFEQIRKVALDKETVYTCYVASEKKLIGVVTIKDMLLVETSTLIADIMERNVISVATADDREEISALFNRYGFLSIPVIDNEGCIVGIITIDDAMDVMQEEAEEDFAKMAAITPDAKPYLKTPAAKICMARIPWLLLLMVSATFTGIIISSFEASLAANVALTAFIPMLMDTGGNSGAQASVTVIRGISIGEIELSDIFRVIWKELRVALMCGALLAVAAFLKILIVDRIIMGNEITLNVALVICLTLFVTVLFAKLIGCILPVVAKKIGFDPAVMASPFITTIVDSVSLFLYFRFASAILHI